MPRSADAPTLVDVYLEVGAKRVFASALAWPGWTRSGRSEEAAVEALAVYTPRFAPVATRAGLTPPAVAGPADFAVVERVTGNASTEFGVPGLAAAADREPLDVDAADRLAGLVGAAWSLFDEIVAVAPAELRKGPRGGGRDRDKIVGHVLDAEGAYVRKIGLRTPAPAAGDRPAVDAHRAAILAVLVRPTDGSPPVDNGWLVPYAARRIAWHVLDHGWEIEDRTG
ncbi:MAG: hypothetical protein ACHQ3P_06535 [Candidatus Limnocylindrales bacterium]